MTEVTVETASPEELWSSLRTLFGDVRHAIERIIQTKAWRPLGYDTFVAAWDDRMKGVGLANAVKPYVIYAMLDEGLALEDVVRATGWEAEQVHRGALDHAAGVPVEGATVVRTHYRGPKTRAKMVHVEFASDEYFWLREITKAQARDLTAESKAAVIAHFKHLETHPRARRAR